MPPIRPAVPASQWDRVYGNGDGQLSLNERGVALTAETVLARKALAVNIKTELERDPTSALRAGETYRDQFGTTQVRIYPGAVGMTPDLVPYVTAHELAHVELNHLDRMGSGANLELEADWYAGRTLADFIFVPASGKIAMKLDEGDHLVGVEVATPRHDLLLAARGGKCVRFPVDGIRVFRSRTSEGVRGMALAEGDRVISMSVLDHVELAIEERDAFLRYDAARRRQDGFEDGEASDEEAARPRRKP